MFEYIKPLDVLVVVVLFTIFNTIVFIIVSNTKTKNIYTNKIYKNKPYILDNVKHEPIKNLNKKFVYSISDSIAKELKHMYVILRDTMEKHKISHWVSGGTLLGAIRHKGFIPWDDDMDVHTKIENINKILSKNFLKDLGSKGYKLTASTISGNAVSAFRMQNINNKTLLPPFIDILFENIVETEYLSRCKIIPDIMIIKDNRECLLNIKNETWKITDIYPLKKHVFEDIWVYIPNNPEKILKIQYGENVMSEIFIPNIKHAGLGYFLSSNNIKSKKIVNTMKDIIKFKKNIGLSNFISFI